MLKGRTAPMIPSLVMGNVLAEALQKFDQCFFDDIGQRAVIAPGEILQVLPEPLLAFPRQINV